MVNTAFSIFPGTYTSFHVLHGFSTGVKELSRCFLALEQACTNFTAPPLWLKLPFRSFLAHIQACTSFTVHPRWLKQLSRCFLPLKQPCTSFTELHSGENCFLDLSWHLHRLPRVSQVLNGCKNSFPDATWHLNRLARTLQHLPSGENRILDVSWPLNRPALTSTVLSWYINVPTRASQVSTMVKTTISDLSRT